MSCWPASARCSRRVPVAGGQPVATFGDVTVDSAARVVTRGGGCGCG